MQLISAVVQPAKVGDISEALQAFGFHGFTVTEVSGFGKRRGQTEIYRGLEYSSGFQHEVKVEVVARDEDVYEMIDLICRVAATGAMGGGKIWVTPVRELVRIRTREVDVDAL